MARLAVRATGDRSRRESVTVGGETVKLKVYSGNTHTFTILVCNDGKQVNVYDESTLYEYNKDEVYDVIHYIHLQSDTHRA